MNDNEILIKHLSDLAQKAYFGGYETFSDFLNLDEIRELKSAKLISPFSLYGGYDSAERCIALFGDEADKESFPIICIKISPVNSKFSDTLSHRDFLGALMNLGISRNTLGDIIVKENTAYLFCLSSMGEYITRNISRIKHTTVKAELLSSTPEFVNELPGESELIVPSLRADAAVSAVYKLSRSKTSELFKTSKVFINSRLCEKESKALTSGDRISVRGFGKFIFDGVIRKTKKNRIVISLRIYK